MNPVYLDLHIHTSDPPTSWNISYDIDGLVKQINKFSKNAPFLISLTDHNTINTTAYLSAVKKGINIIPGVELHIKNYDQADAYHCHIYFNLDIIDKKNLDDLNSKLDKLYPNKIVQKRDPSIPKIEVIINEFEGYDFLLLPHGGQSHARFDMSIPVGIKFDTTIERGIYYNQFDGFTARGNTGLEKTQSYFKKLGINDFVNLVTCTDNYTIANYPKPKPIDSSPFVPTWMLAEPTFEGLRLSLSESSRLIYSDKKPKIWSESIRSVSLLKANIDIDVKLTLGLNVVIGGSSSGKTLLVDTIHRIICEDFENCNYTTYSVDKCFVDNPSGMRPHYLSQNYIMSVVNNATDDQIENIDMLRNVFPGDKSVSRKIDKSLRFLKKQLNDLIDCVKTIEIQEHALQKLPVLSSLITKEKPKGNVFEKMLPSAKESSLYSYDHSDYEDQIDMLDSIEEVLSNSPFIKHDKMLVPRLKKEMAAALRGSDMADAIQSIIDSVKKRVAKAMREQDVKEQSKQQDFQQVLELTRIYALQTRRFNKILKHISEYAVKVNSEEIESMGHKLFIENSFSLNKDIFLELINQYVKTGVKISRFRDITPESLFQRNFKGAGPKVHGYDDFEKRVYKDLQDRNKKVYKIITNDGRNFESLSAGWKTSVILDLILGYEDDMAPIIIDQPEDNLATNYINSGLVNAIKKIKTKKQIVLVSHNATIPMLADAQNIVLCQNTGTKIVIRSAPLEGKIDGKAVVDHIAEITDGGKSSIKKRVKKYNLKNFKE